MTTNNTIEILNIEGLYVRVTFSRTKGTGHTEYEATADLAQDQYLPAEVLNALKTRVWTGRGPSSGVALMWLRCAVLVSLLEAGVSEFPMHETSFAYTPYRQTTGPFRIVAGLPRGTISFVETHYFALDSVRRSLHRLVSVAQWEASDGIDLRYWLEIGFENSLFAPLAIAIFEWEMTQAKDANVQFVYFTDDPMPRVWRISETDAVSHHVFRVEQDMLDDPAARLE